MIWEKNSKVGTVEGKFCENRIPKASHNFRNAIQENFFYRISRSVSHVRYQRDTFSHPGLESSSSQEPIQDLNF